MKCIIVIAVKMETTHLLMILVITLLIKVKFIIVSMIPENIESTECVKQSCVSGQYYYIEDALLPL